MFDPVHELSRATAHLFNMHTLHFHVYDPGDPHFSNTANGLVSYLSGVRDTLEAIQNDTPIPYEDQSITEMVNLAIKKGTLPVSLNLPEEEDRARAYLTMISEQTPPDDPEQLSNHLLTIGILTGIVNALAASQGKTTLTYDPLIPETPEGLTDDD